MDKYSRNFAVNGSVRSDEAVAGDCKLRGSFKLINSRVSLYANGNGTSVIH